MLDNRDYLDAWQAERRKSETPHAAIWSAVERAAKQPGMRPAVVSSLIATANEFIDLHEIRLASIENFLPVEIFVVLLGVAVLAIGFFVGSFGSASQCGFTPLLLLALHFGALLLLIMDLNRPQRGMFEVGSDTLERTLDSMAATSP